MERFFKRPWVIVGVIAALTVFFAAQLPRARMDNNVSSFLPETHPAKVTARHFEAEYGDSITVMVGLERRYGTVFESGFLRRVKKFSEAVEALPLVKSVNSIMSTQYITSDSESIIVTDLVGGNFSGTADEIAELKRRIASWDMYQGGLISDDARAAQIVVQLNATVDHSGDDDVLAALREIRGRAKDAFAGLAEVYTAGQAVVSASLTDAAYADLKFLVPLVVVVLFGILVISFRRASYVTLPLLTVLVAVIWSMGAMPLFGVTLTMMSIMMPVILMAVGSAYGIHVISHYRDEAGSKTVSVEEHRAFVFSLVRRLLKPVFLAALTTFAGFVSFCFAPLSSMRSFGVFASFGVIVAFAAAVTLIPAILLIRGPRAARLAQVASARGAGGRRRGFDFEARLSGALASIAEKKAFVFAVTALVLAVSLVGSTKVISDNAMVEFFSPSSEVARSDRFIRAHFGGSTQLIVSVEADDTETLLHPDTLAAADGLCAYLVERVPHVGKVTGFTDMMKRMNQMFNVGEPPEGIAAKSVTASNTNSANEEEFGFGDFGFDAPEAPQSVGAVPVPASRSPAPEHPTFAMLDSAIGKNGKMSAKELVRELERETNYEGYAYYEIPADPARYGKQTKEELERLVANYLVLLAGDSDDSFSNDPLEPTAFETIVLVDSQWQADSERVVDEIRRYAAANFPPRVCVLVGGGATQEAALSSLVTSSQVVSILIAVICVLLIVAASNKSLSAGLIAALPLSIAILADFAMMGFLRITLNMGTAMIASLAVGIGIDYTIHFIEAYRREFALGGDYLRRTFAGSGKAILINAVSVGASFAVLIFSQFTIVAQFGALVCLSMAVSAVVSLTVIPALLETVKPKFIFGERNG